MIPLKASITIIMGKDDCQEAINIKPLNTFGGGRIWTWCSHIEHCGENKNKRSYGHNHCAFILKGEEKTNT